MEGEKNGADAHGRPPVVPRTDLATSVERGTRERETAAILRLPGLGDQLREFPKAVEYNKLAAKADYQPARDLKKVLETYQ